MSSKSGYPVPIEELDYGGPGHGSCWDSGGPVAVEVLGQWGTENVAVKVLVKKNQCCQPVMTMVDIMRLVNIPKVFSHLQVIESDTRL